MMVPSRRELTSSEGPDHNFDWFLNADYLLPIFEELTADLGKETRILMLGCGNSQLSEAMYDAGWKNIVNIDVGCVRGQAELTAVLDCAH